MLAIKNSGATRRGAGKSQRGLHLIRSRNLGKTSRRSVSTPAVQDTPAAEEVRGIVRRPGHKDIVRLPAGMSSAAGGLEHPDHLIVEMARVQGIARRLTLANSSAISRVRRPNLKGLWRAPWRCHRSGSYFVRPIGGSRATRTSSAQRHQILDLGQRIYPKTRGRGRRRDGKAVDHLRLLRLLIGIL